MKIAILGAGAMGSLYGCYLSKKNEVTLIDVYQAQVDAINQNGVTMVENETEQIFQIPAVKSGTDIGVAELVVVFVKSINTYEAMEENKKLIGPDTIVMTLQNGAENDRDIARFVENSHVVIGTSKHSSVGLGLGKCNHAASGVTTLGTYVTNHITPEDTAGSALYEAGRKRAECVAKVLMDCGLEVIVSDDIQRIIWSKLFVNMSVNTLSALLECKIGYMIKNKSAWDFAKRIVYEAVEVAEADGTYFDRREALETVHKVCEKAGDGYASMYQDRKAHRKTEIDRINGAVVRQAKLYGVPTPYNSLVVDLLHAVEGTYLPEEA